VPRLNYCRLLVFYLLTGQIDYDRIFIDREDRKNCHNHYYKCKPAPFCHPLNNWNYIFLPNTIMRENSSISLTTVVRLAVLVTLPRFETFYLVRGMWHKYNDEKEESSELRRTLKIINLTKIQADAERGISNYNGEIFWLYSPFRIAARYSFFEEDFNRSIIRKEPAMNSVISMGFAIIIKVTATPKFSMSPSGPNGLSKELRSMTNSFSIALGVNEERWKDVAYSIIFAKGYIIFITHKPYLAGYSFKFLFQPFHPYVWLAITVTLVMSVATVTLLMFKHVQRDRGRFLEIPKTLVILLSTLLDQPSSQKDFRHSLKFKTIFGLWALGGIVLSNSYKSTIVAFLIQPSYV
jgi:hypothetical protein